MHCQCASLLRPSVVVCLIGSREMTRMTGILRKPAWTACLDVPALVYGGVPVLLPALCPRVWFKQVATCDLAGHCLRCSGILKKMIKTLAIALSTSSTSSFVRRRMDHAPLLAEHVCRCIHIDAPVRRHAVAVLAWSSTASLAQGFRGGGNRDRNRPCPRSVKRDQCRRSPSLAD